MEKDDGMFSLATEWGFKPWTARVKELNIITPEGKLRMENPYSSIEWIQIGLSEGLSLGVEYSTPAVGGEPPALLPQPCWGTDPRAFSLSCSATPLLGRFHPEAQVRSQGGETVNGI